jgi:phytoene dehydrogenase-like protein
MESVFMVQLGVAGYDPARFQPSPLCYYYGTYDVEYSIDECLRGEYHEGRHGFVLYVPTMHSPELAPEGRHAVTIYTIAPNTLSQGTWSARREEMEDKLLRHAERMMPGLRKAATTRLTLTPDDFRARTGLAHHAFGGLAPVMGQQAPRHQTPLEGLWFVGSESESGGGVANVMLGARKAAKGILARLPQPKP